jgi:hypothetical protein
MTLDEYFSTGPPRERPIFDAVLEHLESLGEVHVEPVSVGILLKRARGFAELRPKVNWVELSIGLTRTITHPKITRVMRGSGVRTYHCVRLREPRDVDADVREWLTEAYVAADA